MPVLGVTVGFLWDRRQGTAPCTLLPPGRRDDAHAEGALDRAHYVDAARDRPPARSRLLHEAEALEPQLLPERRRVAAELAAVQLEAEHAQPVAQAYEADELQVPGRRAVAPREHLPQPPQRPGVEARDHHLPVRYQHALGLAQHLVR